MTLHTAAIDASSKQTMTARLKTDGLTITRINADPATNAMGVSTNILGAVTPSSWAATDENGRISLMAVSEVDGVTPVALQCDSSGNLLIKHI